MDMQHTSRNASTMNRHEPQDRQSSYCPGVWGGGGGGGLQQGSNCSRSLCLSQMK